MRFVLFRTSTSSSEVTQRRILFGKFNPTHSFWQVKRPCPRTSNESIPYFRNQSGFSLVITAGAHVAFRCVFYLQRCLRGYLSSGFDLGQSCLCVYVTPCTKPYLAWKAGLRIIEWDGDKLYPTLSLGSSKSGTPKGICCNQFTDSKERRSRSQSNHLISVSKWLQLFLTSQTKCRGIESKYIWRKSTICIICSCKTLRGHQVMVTLNTAMGAHPSHACVQI